MATRKKFAVVGLGGRSRMFYQAVGREFKETSRLVGFCDVNQTRMNHANKFIEEECKIKPVRTYGADQFDQMINDGCMVAIGVFINPVNQCI